MKLLRTITGPGMFFLAALCAGLLLFGCATPPEPREDYTVEVPNVTPPKDRNNVYKLKVDDAITVTFSGIDGIPQHDERIKEDGRITLPLIGSIVATNKSTGDLQQEIHDLYVPKYYLNLTVTVRCENKYYYVDGEVKGPGKQAYVGETTVLKAIASVSGFTDYANRRKVRVTHENGKFEIVDCIKAQSNPDLDKQIFPDDQIYVPRKLF